MLTPLPILQPKRSFPPICPATGQDCLQKECPSFNDYAWNNVFLSVPYSKSYGEKEQAIRDLLERYGFRAIVAKDEHSARPVALSIFQSMCKSSHAIVDLSAIDADQIGGGVLLENGFIRSTMRSPNIIHVVSRGTKLPAEASTLNYHRYDDLKSLCSSIERWVKDSLIGEERSAIERMLTARNSADGYHLWYHCIGPTGKAASPVAWRWNLTGGGTGSTLLSGLLRTLRRDVETKVHPPTADDPTKNRNELTLIRRASEGNLLLLDAPIGLHDKLNWMIEPILNESKNVLSTPLSVGFRFLENDEQKQYPKEEKCISYPANPCCVSTPEEDFGMILRIPNPFRKGAIVLVMAGIHAPASYAAAAAMATPSDAISLMRRLHLSPSLAKDEIFFEAVFKVKRTYSLEDLDAPEWVYTRPLHAIHADDTRNC